MTVTNTSLIVLLLSRCYSARPRGVHPRHQQLFFRPSAAAPIVNETEPKLALLFWRFVFTRPGIRPRVKPEGMCGAKRARVSNQDGGSCGFEACRRTRKRTINAL
jgi:hypothetical protein